jgi:hypothetical protein
MQSLWPIGGANRAIFGMVIELAEDEGREVAKKLKRAETERGLTGQAEKLNEGFQPNGLRRKHNYCFLVEN